MTAFDKPKSNSYQRSQNHPVIETKTASPVSPDPLDEPSSHEKPGHRDHDHAGDPQVPAALDGPFRPEADAGRHVGVCTAVAPAKT